MLLLVALALVVAGAAAAAVRRSPRRDWLALAFGAFVVVYALMPQSWLGGGATHKGVLYGRGTTCCRSPPTSSAAGST